MGDFFFSSQPKPKFAAQAFQNSASSDFSTLVSDQSGASQAFGPTFIAVIFVAMLNLASLEPMSFFVLKSSKSLFSSENSIIFFFFHSNDS